jgi:hypothetical protein
MKEELHIQTFVIDRTKTIYLLPDGRGHNYAENIWMFKIVILNSKPLCQDLDKSKTFRHCKSFVHDTICSMFNIVFVLSITKVCMCNSSFILNENSSKLCKLPYYYIKICISWQCDRIIIEGIIALFD